MIKFFRQSYAIQYVVLAIFAVALWMPAFLQGSVNLVEPSPVTPLYNWFSGLLNGSSYAMLIIAFVLMLLESLFFNSMLVANQVIGKVSTIGAFVFLLFMNLTTAQTDFFPFALSLIFVLAAVHICFLVYQTSNPEIYLFNAGAFLALGSMCYFPLILLVLWIMSALIVSHFTSMRLHIIPLIGCLFPYLIYFAASFLFGDFLNVIHGYSEYFAGFHLTVSEFQWKHIVLMALLSFFVFVPLANGRNFSFEKSVAVRSKVTMTIILAIFSVVLLFVGGNPLTNGLLFVALSIMASYDLSSIAKTSFTDLLLYILVALVMLNHYWLKVI